jgi:hypothetical protein
MKPESLALCIEFASGIGKFAIRNFISKDGFHLIEETAARRASSADSGASL